MKIQIKNIKIFLTFFPILMVIALFFPQNIFGESWETFQKECFQKFMNATNIEGITIKGTNGWLFSKAELRHIGVGQFWDQKAASVSLCKNPRDVDPLPAILDFKSQLDALGIELILVPVPAKAFIYPEGISKTIKTNDNIARLDYFHQTFYDLLKSKGIHVLDLTPIFLKQRFEKSALLYCKQDTHWSCRGAIIAAKQLANEIKKRKWNIIPKKYQTMLKDIEINGDLYQSLNDSTIKKEKLPLRFIRNATSGQTLPTPVETDPDSPILLIGDSHTLIYHSGGDMHATGAGLADQLAYQLGFPIDLLGVKGSGVTAARISLYRKGKVPGYLEKKKLIIWCFTSRDFTEANEGWRKVPVRK